MSDVTKSEDRGRGDHRGIGRGIVGRGPPVVGPVVEISAKIGGDAEVARGVGGRSDTEIRGEKPDREKKRGEDAASGDGVAGQDRGKAGSERA